MAKKYDLKLKGTVGYWDFNKNTVDNVLERLADQEVHVLIDSLGGYVGDALSISSAFANHGNVHVHYRGMNASAATISSMGAKHISIDANALYLVHNCSVTVFEWAALNAEQLEKKAEEYKKLASETEKIDIVVATMYAKRCKKSVQELHDLMAEDKFLTAQEALEWGFVDEVIDSDEKVVLKASVASAMAAAGMPVPDMEVEADGFLEKLMTVLQKAFKGSNTTAGVTAKVEAVQAPVHEASDNPDNSNQQNSEAMKKVYALVAAVLAAVTASKFEADAEGKYTLDEPQMDALEASLKAAQDKEAALTAEKQALQEQLNSANATIDELKRKPVDDGEQVVTTGSHAGGDSPLETMQANIAEARRMLGKD